MATLGQIIDSITGSRKTLWILCGLPYSGKTYLSEQIIKRTSITYVSIDSILESSGFSWDSGHLPDEQNWKKIFTTSYENCREALQNNLNVLYDSTNHTKASRDELRIVAEKAGAETRVIFVDTPVPVVWQRWEENKRQKSRALISKDLVAATIASFERPSNTEKVFHFQKIN